MNKAYQADQSFQNQNFQKKGLLLGEYESCDFTNCSFLNADLSGIIFSECSFVDCDLSMATVKGTAFRDTKFKNCKLLGLRFDDCNPFSLSFDFEGCILHFASFFRLKIPRTVFKNCKLEDVEFVEADVSNAVFILCDLSRAIFEGTNLEGADLRSAFNFSIDPEKNRIQKGKYTAQNLSGLLDNYKLVIE
jgi:fluoroquinolone resistance protein